MRATHAWTFVAILVLFCLAIVLPMIWWEL
jgi:hypothetical protein